MISYQHTWEEIAEKSPINPGWLKERVDLAGARSKSSVFGTANRELRGLYDRMLLVIRGELAAQGIPERDRSRLAATMCGQFAKTEPLFTTLRDQDEAIITELLNACDLARQGLGTFALRRQHGHRCLRKRCREPWIQGGPTEGLGTRARAGTGWRRTSGHAATRVL